MNKNDLRKLIKEVFDEITTEEKPLNELSLKTMTLNQFLDNGLTEADMLGATTREVPAAEMQDYLKRVKDKEKLTTLKSLINEMINEIDWSRFNDVQTQCISPEEMVKRLNDILARSKLPSTERDKRDVNFPIVTKHNIRILYYKGTKTN